MPRKIAMFGPKELARQKAERQAVRERAGFAQEAETVPNQFGPKEIARRAARAVERPLGHGDNELTPKELVASRARGAPQGDRGAETTELQPAGFPGHTVPSGVLVDPGEIPARGNPGVHGRGQGVNRLHGGADDRRRGLDAMAASQDMNNGGRLLALETAYEESRSQFRSEALKASQDLTTVDEALRELTVRVTALEERATAPVDAVEAARRILGPGEHD